MLGQIERRLAESPVTASAGSEASAIGSVSGSRRSATGTTTWRSSGLSACASTIVTGRGPAVGLRSAAEEAPDLLDRALRGGQADALERLLAAVGAHAAPPAARASAPGATRACSPATAWISSRITDSTSASVSRAREVSIRYSDSGVVIRMSGGWRSIAARSFWGVSPVRMPTGDLLRARDRGQRHSQVALDVVAERLQRRDVDDPGAVLTPVAPLTREAVDGPQERSERLARAGGGD